MTQEQKPTVEELERAKVDFDLCHKMLSKDCGFVAGINKETFELISNLFTQALEIAKGDSVVVPKFTGKSLYMSLFSIDGAVWEANDYTELWEDRANKFNKAMIAVAEGEK